MVLVSKAVRNIALSIVMLILVFSGINTPVTKAVGTKDRLLYSTLSSSKPSSSKTDELGAELLELVRTSQPMLSKLAVLRADLESVTHNLIETSDRLSLVSPKLEARLQQARQVAVSIYVDGDTSIRVAALSAASDPLEYATRIALVTPTAQAQALSIQPLADEVRSLSSHLKDLQEQSTALTAEVEELEKEYVDIRKKFFNLSHKLTSFEDVSILGPALLNAEELASFMLSRSAGWKMPVSRIEFAQMYLDEAAAEGIRGDLLLVQGIMETGWFRFDGNGLSDEDDFNFAGINACDSCKSASKFESVRMGIRAHVQLVRAYVDADYTSADTALPAAYHVETIPVRGCCVLWSELGRRWASAKGYYRRVLWTWQSALEFSGKKAPWK